MSTGHGSYRRGPESARKVCHICLSRRTRCSEENRSRVLLKLPTSSVYVSTTQATLGGELRYRLRVNSAEPNFTFNRVPITLLVCRRRIPPVDPLTDKAVNLLDDMTKFRIRGGKKKIDSRHMIESRVISESFIITPKNQLIYLLICIMAIPSCNWNQRTWHIYWVSESYFCVTFSE